MPKIYIPNKGVHDYSSATQYGELIFLSHGKFKLLSIGRMFRTFEPYLKESSPNDYIMLAGATVMNVIACVIFAILHSKLNLLIYSVDHRGDGQYKKRTIMLDDLAINKDDLK